MPLTLGLSRKHKLVLMSAGVAVTDERDARR
jgi:hypothetical protein